MKLVLALALLLAGCGFDGPNPFPDRALKERHLSDLPQPLQPKPFRSCGYVDCKKR